ncbi:hypothetical protein [Rothia sp. (in: high G+C Gram-positive bacteria)]|uniref:hypothetical protein n=1 Tax=Rothia sp. (in: high G+C Gram-positive bacteria) TaxID=1885016 RepID=UPI000EC7DEE6|nr:hypothetical protein [Rothia sp. (in: high G+C Gram-positive bacteria)]
MKLKMLATATIVMGLATVISSLWSFFRPEEFGSSLGTTLLGFTMVLLVATTAISSRQHQQKSVTGSRDSMV